MALLPDLRPWIRVAHFYQFPYERNASETNRIGYCYAFHLIAGGKGKAEVAGQSFSVQKGDLLYFPPTLKHSFYSSPEQLLSSCNIYCELWEDAPPATEQHLVWNEADFSPDFVTKVVSGTELDALPYYLPLQHHSALAEIFPHIVEQHKMDDVYSREITSHLLKAFILELVQHAEQKPLQDYRIKAIMDRIDKEAGAGAQYESWLVQSGLKKTQFHEVFKMTAGMPPKAYWTKAVMKQAAVALWESNRSITHIAEDFGYSSIHHFTKQFTAFYGLSPSAYRKRRDGGFVK